MVGRGGGDAASLRRRDACGVGEVHVPKYRDSKKNVSGLIACFAPFECNVWRSSGGAGEVECHNVDATGGERPRSVPPREAADKSKLDALRLCGGNVASKTDVWPAGAIISALVRRLQLPICERNLTLPS